MLFVYKNVILDIFREIENIPSDKFIDAWTKQNNENENVSSIKLSQFDTRTRNVWKSFLNR